MAEKQTITVTLDPRESFRRLQQEAREEGLSTQEVAVQRAKDALQALDDMVRMGARGATWGWADEIAAMGGAAFSPETYEQRLPREQFRTEQAKARLGPGAVPLEMAGAIGTGGPAYQLGTQALRQVSPLLRYTVPGAIEGGIAGAGYADPGQRGQGAAIGAVTGGVVGGAIPAVKPVAKAIGGGVRGLYNRIRDPGGERTAAARVREAAERDELSGPEVRARVERMGEGTTLMDVGGPNLQGLGANLARTPGAAQRRMRTTLSTRQSKQGKDALRSLRKNLQVGNREYSDELQQIIDRRATEADQFYRAARGDMALLQDTDTPIFTSKAVRDLVDQSADINQAIKRAQRLPKFRGSDKYSWDMVDRGYKYLNDRLEKLERAGKRAQARDIRNLKDDFRAAILKENPTYAKALDAYAGDSALVDAAEAGRKFARNEGEVNREVLERMSDLEKEMFRIGVVRESRKLIQGGGASWESNAVRRIFKNPEQVKTLEPVFPSRREFLQFVREMIPLERQYQTYKNVFTGSPSAPRLSEEASAGMTDAARQWMSGNRETALEMGFRWAKDKIAPDTDEIRKATARFLAPKTPQELQRSLDVISGVKKPSLRKRLANQVVDYANQTFGQFEAGAPVVSAIVAEEQLGE